MLPYLEFRDSVFKNKILKSPILKMLYQQESPVSMQRLISLRVFVRLTLDFTQTKILFWLKKIEKL